jgi:hypothetical protein
MLTVPQRFKPLNCTEETILKTVKDLRFASAQEILRWHFATGSYNHARKMLTKLSGGDWQDDGYLYRFALPTSRGNSPRIYTLSRRGAEFLRTNGVPVDWYFQPVRLRSYSYSYLLHQLAVARLIVCANLFVREHPAYQLTETLLSHDLLRNAPMTALVTDGQERQVMVLPDAWVYVITDGQETALWFEVDRGTEYRQRFQQLVRARLALIERGQYAAYFGTPVIRVCYLVVSSVPYQHRETRLTTLRRWTAEVLTEQHREDWISVFRFSTIDFTQMYEQTHRLFAEPVWYFADDSVAVPLFDTTTPTDQTAAVAGKETTDGDDSETSSDRV